MARKKAADMKRARNGAGSITILPNGKVRLSYMMPANPITGKPSYRTTVDRATEEEARLEAAKRVAAVAENTYTTPSYMKMSVWIEKYKNEFMDHLKPNTKIERMGSIDRYIMPTLGKYRLFELNSSLIKGTYNQLQKKSARGGVSACTIRSIHGLLRTMLKKAVAMKYLPENPTDDIVLPRVERKEMAVIKDDDIGRFLEAIKGHRFEFLYFVDMFCGARQGEILGLQWSDVDFKNNTITISTQLQRERVKGGEYRLVSLKTDRRGVRTLTEPQEIMDVLRHVRSMQAQWKLALGSEYNNPMNLVFTTNYGRHLVPCTTWRALKKIVASIGLDDVRFHDLRHSFFLYAHESGYSMKEIQEALGHTNYSTTMNTYGHLSPHTKKESADRKGEFIRSVWKKQA